MITDEQKKKLTLWMGRCTCFGCVSSRRDDWINNPTTWDLLKHLEEKGFMWRLSCAVGGGYVCDIFRTVFELHNDFSIVKDASVSSDPRGAVIEAILWALELGYA